ncbi:hypothetical protein EMPG_14624, partial [Blastomyces silverae]
GDTKSSRAAGKNGRWGHREKRMVVNKVSRRDEWWRSSGKRTTSRGLALCALAGFPVVSYMFPNLPLPPPPLLGAWCWGSPPCFVSIDAHRNISALNGWDVDCFCTDDPHL